MFVLALGSNSVWNEGQIVLVILAVLVVVVLFWATILRGRITNLVTKSQQQSAIDQQNEHLYAELVEHASDVVLRLDPGGNILAINKAGAELLGYDARVLAGKNLGNFISPGTKESLSFDGSKEYAVSDLVLLDRTGEPVHLEMSLRRERVDGQTRSAEIIARNITERRRLEAQLRQSERMQAMGLLAGGIAHDFNNYLTVILNFADLALESQPSDDIKQMLQEIRKAGLLASDMSRHMLDFSRRQTLPPQRVQLNPIIQNLQRMLHSALGKQMDLKLQLTTGLPEILADVGSLEQILMNLILNARDAMGETGKVTIRTLPSSNHKNVILEITDTGAGMDAATKAQLFQPFFTTKDPGKGTGLGLASIQRIMMKLGGTIAVDSQPGQGSTFRLTFPATLPNN